MRITAVGDCALDIFERGQRAGGCSLNFAAHYKSLSPGDDVRLVSVIGDDQRAEFLRPILLERGLSTHVETRSGETAVDHRNRDSTMGYTAGVLNGWCPTGECEEAASLVRGSDLVMTVVYRQLEQLFAWVLTHRPSNGVLGADFMDLGDYEDDFARRLSGWLPQVDVAFFGLNSVNNADQIRWLTQTSTTTDTVLVLTFAADGARVLHRGETWDAPSVVANEVDRTGAGDSFAAAFLHQWTQKQDPVAALTAAHLHAAKTVGYLSGFPQ